MIGRSSQYCQIILTEQDISRKHCSIKYEYQGSTSAYYVTDYSTFGVIVNDSQKLEKGVTQRLPKGTKLTLGQEATKCFMLKKEGLKNGSKINTVPEWTLL